MNKDWDAVAAAISTRMDELEMTQQQLAGRAGVSLQTVRELQHNLVPRKRTPRTLEAMSTALNLPKHHLGTVLEGGDSTARTVEAPTASEMSDVKRQLAEVTERLGKIESRLAEND